MALAESGYAMVLAGRRREPLEELASALTQRGQRALAILIGKFRCFRLRL
jgi:NADP-dependent 3-hydroxy acid dehydrogenase YdfG